MSNGPVLSPANSQFLWANLPITGRATGSYFTFSYNATNQVTVVGGVDGTGYYVVTGDYTATMTVTVQPGSVANDLFSTSFLAFKNAPNGIRTPVLVKQKGTHFSGFGVVAGLAPLEYSDAATSRVWTIVSANMDGFVAGLTPAPIVQ